MDIVNKFDGLLDEEATRMLSFPMLPKIKDANGFVGLYGKILSVGKVKKVGKNLVKNILIGDETGCCILALWGKNTEIELKEGDAIKVVNAVVKEGYYGKEINAGERSEIRKVERNIYVKKCNNFFNIEGILTKKLPTQVYFNGEHERFIKKIFVGDDCIYLINERIKDINDIEIGSKIEIKWAYVRNGKIFVDDIGRISRK